MSIQARALARLQRKSLSTKRRNRRPAGKRRDGTPKVAFHTARGSRSVIAATREDYALYCAEPSSNSMPAAAANSAKRQRSPPFSGFAGWQSLRASTKTMSSDIRHLANCLRYAVQSSASNRLVRSEHEDKQQPLLAFFMVSSALLHAF